MEKVSKQVLNQKKKTGSSVISTHFQILMAEHVFKRYITVYGSTSEFTFFCFFQNKPISSVGTFKVTLL